MCHIVFRPMMMYPGPVLAISYHPHAPGLDHTPPLPWCLVEHVCLHMRVCWPSALSNAHVGMGPVVQYFPNNARAAQPSGHMQSPTKTQAEVPKGDAKVRLQHPLQGLLVAIRTALLG